MNLVQLIYLSHSIGPPSDEILLDIRREALAFNGEAKITGVLCYAFGKFLQVLEGPTAKVNALYLKIGNDKRHEKMQLLSFQPIEKPSFAMWSMKVIRLEENVSKEARSLIQHNQFGTFEPETWDAVKSMSFLSELARTIPEIK